jgi:hypothetical protein
MTGEPMEVHVSDLTWDQFIYPRGGKSEKTIDAYVETLAIGAQFPPIKIQRVFNYPSSPPFSKGGKGGFSDQTTEATIILMASTAGLRLRRVESKRFRPLNGRTSPLITKKAK